MQTENGVKSRWTITSLLTVLIFLIGMFVGQRTIRTDVDANTSVIQQNCTDIRVVTTRVDGIDKSLDEIKAGIIEINRKLDVRR